METTFFFSWYILFFFHSCLNFYPLRSQKQIDLKGLRCKRSSSCNCGYCFEYLAVFKMHNVPSTLNFFIFILRFNCNKKRAFFALQKINYRASYGAWNSVFFFHNQKNELFPRIKRPNFLITFLEQAPINKS